MPKLKVSPSSATLGPNELVRLIFEGGEMVQGGSVEPNIGTLDASDGMDRYDAIYTAPSNIPSDTSVRITLINNPWSTPKYVGFADILLTSVGKPPVPPGKGNEKTYSLQTLEGPVLKIVVQAAKDRPVKIL